MRESIKYILWVILSFVMIGCQRDKSDYASTQDEGYTSMRFNVSVDSAVEVQSRATLTNSDYLLDANDTFVDFRVDSYITVSGDENDSELTAAKVEYFANGGGWTLESEEMWSSSTIKDIYAIAPYIGDDDKNITINKSNIDKNLTITYTLPSAAEDQVDLMVATAEGTKLTDLIDLHFDHTLATLSFSAQVAASEDASYNVPAMVSEIRVTGVPNRAKLTVGSNGSKTWSIESENGTDELGYTQYYENTFTAKINTEEPNAGATQLTTTDGYLMMFPGELTNYRAQVEIDITPINGSAWEKHTMYIPLVGTTWEAGTLYKYNIQISEYDIALNDNIYEIYTAKGLAAFRDLVNGVIPNPNTYIYNDGITFSTTSQNNINGILLNDIDLSSICNSEDGSWSSIGNANIGYSGTFDGNNKTISNLYINTATNNSTQSEQFVGLFGTINSSGDHTVKNLTVGGSVTQTVSSYDGNYKSWVGMIAGSNNGIISCCTTTEGSSVFNNRTGTSVAATGGIVGHNANLVERCVNNADVTGYWKVGGVVGYLDYNYVVNCGNTGTVTNKHIVYSSNVQHGTGGIIGLGDSNTYVYRCYNWGDVSSDCFHTGGISGYTNGTKTSGCYNTGYIFGYDYVGGIVGRAYDHSNVTDSYYLTGYVSSTTEETSTGAAIGDRGIGHPNKDGADDSNDATDTTEPLEDTYLKSEIFVEILNAISSVSNSITAYKWENINLGTAYPTTDMDNEAN